MSKIIKKLDLTNLIEKHFIDDLVEDYFHIKKIRAKDLLTYTRFDLGFKLLYLEMLSNDLDFSKEVYKEHIRAFSLGKYTEYGNEDKIGIDRFISDFDKTFKDIKENGYDGSKSLIPLSENGSILNGAHRVASSIFLDKDVECINIDLPNQVYDYKFFYNRNVSKKMLDIAATKFVEYAENTFIAFLWPIAEGFEKEIEKVIPNIVYRKKITLTRNGAHNLISKVYFGEKWLGNIENNFSGSQGKLKECFPNFNPVRIIVFQAENLKEVLKIKDSIRNIFNVGKHSIHITDTKEEAVAAARMVLNDNSIHFLNYAKPNRYILTHKKIDKFKNFLYKNNLTPTDVVLDSGIIMSIYGLRECSDVDYLINDNNKIKHDVSEFDYHEGSLKYHEEDKLSLIYNPKNYFYFKELKFLSFYQLYKMKINRDEEKDQNDCKIMDAMIEKNTVKELFYHIKQTLYYEKVRLKPRVKNLLKILKLEALARRIYKKVRKKK
ncbi:conserved hypothetical protein [Tenacibaculum litoreum]|uniref:hypothetical protein n=1 Tax=Tenacibaculum litoreum TaxID=321269 RepID=UPI00389493E1